MIVRAETGSTNDDAWDAAFAGAADGTVVVADAQLRGRGRAGRSWQTAAGRGLALSVLLRPGCDREAAATAPLVVGLALVRALDAWGVSAELKWPNDVLARGRKLAGVLCESRRLADGADAIVAGVGVNVAQRPEDFPVELRDTATSLAIEGHVLERERVAAAILNALEPLWDELEQGDPSAALDAWRARARFWGRTITVRTPGGEITGVATALAADGALVLRSEHGGERRVLAGDVLPAPAVTS
jgi:BirA family biotin operon repressor/biotin-[acetyl-CoA-carboxylase] ligase